MTTKRFICILLLLVLGLLFSPKASAAIVGHITQIEGNVDLLKKGQLPAIPLKLQDRLEMGDLVRTKSLSRAQITFVDDTNLTIGPESRITIEAYMIDESKGKRNAVLQMLQGLALVVVSKVYPSNDENFVVKTHTAVMGIRGTEVGIRLFPNYSEFLDFKGRVHVQSNLRTVSGVVELGPSQGTRVERGLPPTKAFVVSAADREQFMNQLKTGLVALPKSSTSHNKINLPTSTNVISVVNTLPPSSIMAPPQRSPAVSDRILTNIAPTSSTLPTGSTPTSPPVTTVGGPPSLSGMVPIISPGLSGTSPGLSGSGPPGQIGTNPGLSRSGPPGQLKK